MLEEKTICACCWYSLRKRVSPSCTSLDNIHVRTMPTYDILSTGSLHSRRIITTSPFEYSSSSLLRQWKFQTEKRHKKCSQGGKIWAVEHFENVSSVNTFRRYDETCSHRWTSAVVTVDSESRPTKRKSISQWREIGLRLTAHEAGPSVFKWQLSEDGLKTSVQYWSPEWSENYHSS